MNILELIFSRKWAMSQSALHALIEIVTRTLEDPQVIAQAFHGKNYEEYLQKDNQPKKHALLDSMDYPRIENTYRALQIEDVAIIPVIGSIFPRGASVPMSYGANVKIDHLMHDFNTVFNSSDINTIINIYDTPGGEVTGVSEGSQMMFEAGGGKNKRKKKIISFVYGMAGSAGYWFASSGDEIVAADTAEVGSIGVVATYTDYAEYDKKKGIKRHEVVSNLSPNKRPDMSTEEGRGQILTVVNDLATVFVSTVAKQRGISFEEVLKNYGQGGMFVAEKALKLGMIDRISTLSKLIDEVKTNKSLIFTGGTYMNMQELKEKNPELYDEMIAEGKKEAITDNEKAVTDAKEQGKQEGITETEKKTVDQEKEDKENEKKAVLEKSQKSLSEALNDVGRSEPGDISVSSTEKSFIDNAAKSMNAARKL